MDCAPHEILCPSFRSGPRPAHRVLDSIESEDRSRCVDLFERPDLSWGFEEWRHEPEDPGNWWRVGNHAGMQFANRNFALAEALRRVVWLRGAQVSNAQFEGSVS